MVFSQRQVLLLVEIPAQWQVRVGIFWGHGAFPQPINHLTGGCCLSFCIGQALHAHKGHSGSNLLVIRTFPLNNGKQHPGAHLFFMWSRGVEDREVCHNYR